MVNLRIFNCFGPTEAPDRMIKASIKRSLAGKPIIVHQDKIMDFFYIGDLLKVIEMYIDNDDKNLPNDINMSYMDKISLIEIAEHINNLTNNQKPVIIDSTGKSRPYCGDGSVLHGLFSNELDGAKEGIKKTYEELKNGR